MSTRSTVSYRTTKQRVLWALQRFILETAFLYTGLLLYQQPASYLYQRFSLAGCFQTELNRWLLTFPYAFELLNDLPSKYLIELLSYHKSIDSLVHPISWWQYISRCFIRDKETIDIILQKCMCFGYVFFSKYFYSSKVHDHIFQNSVFCFIWKTFTPKL